MTEAPYVAQAREALADVNSEVKFNPPQTHAAMLAWYDRVKDAQAVLDLSQKLQAWVDSGANPQDFPPELAGQQDASAP